MAAGGPAYEYCLVGDIRSFRSPESGIDCIQEIKSMFGSAIL